MNKKYCQNPLCYARDTQDRLKGRRVVSNIKIGLLIIIIIMGVALNNVLNDFLEININRIISYIGALVDTPTRPQQQYY